MSGTLRLSAVLLAIALFASSLVLVTAQYRARSLFVDLEAAQQESRRLDAEANRLSAELGGLTQPASIANAARSLGLRPIEPARTIYLTQSATQPAAGEGAR